MGNSDSKVAAGEGSARGSTVQVVSGKESQFSPRDGDSSKSGRTPEKREAGKSFKRNGGPNSREGDVVKKSYPKRIPDEQINVNMPMADLMAYLQVVANNSNHLPLTRRDDPELDRTVSSLSSEDYARKSAAFVPSDVRVIGGTFSRYGRVWDLPTSEVCFCVVTTW
jgi:hypothetical protein